MITCFFVRYFTFLSYFISFLYFFIHIFCMRAFEDLKLAALKSLDVADYLLNHTFPLVKEPKLLLAILENIHVAHVKVLEAILVSEDGSVDPSGNFFDLLSATGSFLDSESLSLIKEVYSLIIDHKDAAVEFSRDEKFIICLDNYNLKLLGVEELKGYIFKSKRLLERVFK